MKITGLFIFALFFISFRLRLLGTKTVYVFVQNHGGWFYVLPPSRLLF